jgi:hypothetical protein
MNADARAVRRALQTATCLYDSDLTLATVPSRRYSLPAFLWSGVGTALVAIAGVFAFGETMNVMKLASLAIIVLGVAGLSAAGGAH